MANIREFFTVLYGDPLEGHSLLIWTPGDRTRKPRARWYGSIDAAVEAVNKLNGKTDVYFGVCLIPNAIAQVKGPYKRMKAEDVSIIPGLWLDVDYGGPNRPTKEEALGIIEGMPYQPSIIVATGHGYHAYWLFHEPEEVTDDNRGWFKRLAYGWNKLAQKQARGRKVDNVGDLPRIMRVPGTINCKDPDNRVTAKIIKFDPFLRYSPDDLEGFIIMDVDPEPAEPDSQREINLDPQKPPNKGQGGTALIINPKATPPQKKLDVLLTNSEKFKLTWTRQRTDLEDQSLSGYDLSLAIQMMEAGWTDQEIVDALIAFRRKYGDAKAQKKVCRLDYLERTLQRARQVIAKLQKEAATKKAEQKVEKLRDSAEQIAMEVWGGLTEETRQKGLKLVSTELGIEIRDIYKTDEDDPEYYLIVCGANRERKIRVGRYEKLLSQLGFRAAIAKGTGYLVDPVGRKTWNAIVKILTAICREVDVGDAKPEVAIQNYLKEYIADRAVTSEVDVAANEDMPEPPGPISKGGEIWIKLADFKNWLKAQGFLISNNQLGKVLRSLGCEPRKLRIRRILIHRWQVPKMEGME